MRESEYENLNWIIIIMRQLVADKLMCKAGIARKYTCRKINNSYKFITSLIVCVSLHFHHFHFQRFLCVAWPHHLLYKMIWGACIKRKNELKFWGKDPHKNVIHVCSIFVDMIQRWCWHPNYVITSAFFGIDILLFLHHHLIFLNLNI